MASRHGPFEVFETAHFNFRKLVVNHSLPLATNSPNAEPKWAQLRWPRAGRFVFGITIHGDISADPSTSNQIRFLLPEQLGQLLYLALAAKT